MFTTHQYINISYVHTLKKSFVDPESTVPYLICVCLARSSADSMGDCILSTVRKAAKLAVYDDMTMSVKNHHTLPTMRPETDLTQTNAFHQYIEIYIVSIICSFTFCMQCILTSILACIFIYSGMKHQRLVFNYISQDNLRLT